MANYKFLFSDVKPMAWLYKLKEMGRPKKYKSSTLKSNYQRQPGTELNSENPLTTPQPKRASYNFTTLDEDFVLIPPSDDHTNNNEKLSNGTPSEENPFPYFADPPRKSSKARPRRIRTQPRSKPPVPCKCNCHGASDEFKTLPTEPSSTIGSGTGRSRDNSMPSTPETTERGTNKNSSLGHFDKHLPPIKAKPEKYTHTRKKTMIDEESKATPRHSIKTPGMKVKIRLSSPRIGGKKIQMVCARKSVESLAISKASYDPQRDFMESMMAMIISYNIRAPGDLEELLARYLSLNSDEYHDLIVKVFEEIWFLLKDDHHHGMPL